MRVIAVCGTNGAGKDTLVEYLKQKFLLVHIKVRDLIFETAKNKGIELKNREDFINFTEEYYRQGKSLIKDFLIENKNSDKFYIIESIRRIIEIKDIREICESSIVLGVDAPIQTRYERIVQRKTITDNLSFEKFKEDEERESDGEVETEMNLPKCIESSDIVVNNSVDYKNFYRQIEDKILTDNFFKNMLQ